MKPKLLVIDGVDGIGKSTQVKVLANHYNAKIVAQPSGTNIVGYVRNEVKFNESHNPFARQLLHSLSHVVDAFTEFDGTQNVIMDRSHLCIHTYGPATGLTPEQCNLLFKIHQDIYAYTLKDKFDVSVIFLDRESKYKEELTDNFEKTFSWDNVRKLYLSLFDRLASTDDFVFSPNEKLYYKNIHTHAKEELTKELIELIDKGV
jgi:thymidylate kinase